MTQEPNLMPLPDSFYAALGDNSDCHAALIAEVRAYGEACAAAEREAAARICEKYFHTTCAKVIRRRGGT